MKLLTQARMEYACYLLRYTNYSLEQIADTVGYADSASFAHRFKQLYQISPGRWRNQEDVAWTNQLLSSTKVLIKKLFLLPTLLSHTNKFIVTNIVVMTF